jgi:hypothetical protein
MVAVAAAELQLAAQLVLADQAAAVTAEHLASLEVMELPTRAVEAVAEALAVAQLVAMLAQVLSLSNIQILAQLLLALVLQDQLQDLQADSRLQHLLLAQET